MGRTKAKARRGRGFGGSGPRWQGHPYGWVKKNGDTSALLEYISHLSDRATDSSSGSDDERPTKRVKVADEIPFTTIAQHRLSLSGPCAASALAGDHGLLRDIDGYLSFTPVQGPKPSEEWDVVVSFHAGNSSDGRQYLKPRIESPVTPELVAALRLAIAQGSVSEADNSLWASIDVHVHKQDAELRLDLSVNVNWNEPGSSHPAALPAWLYDLREAYVGAAFGWSEGVGASKSPWTPQDFYEAATVPQRGELDACLASMEIPRLEATLYPFQRRAVNWLLQRENTSWAECLDLHGADVQPITTEMPALPLSFQEARDIDGEKFYASPLLGILTRDVSAYQHMRGALKGGILAEEMGLGKTLEMTALVALHRRPEEPDHPINSSPDTQLRSTGATLIISPQPLLEQWLSELERHAPSLHVTNYTGLRGLAKAKQSEQDMVNLFTESDIVVTTYEVLRNDFYSAIDPPERQMRRAKAYERKKSPLVQMSWWRVCIDEAQMVENFASKTAVLARLIPRVNAWSITGTPVKDDVRKDLRGLLVFLHYEPFASDTHLWNRLTSGRKDFFQSLFKMVTLRHTKSMVRDEITLPPQKRFVITMPFTAVEEQHYQELFTQLTEACGLDTEGHPVKDNWDPTEPGVAEAMRVALDRLRQTALHPEIGHRNRRALGHRNGPMRTVAEVLDAMLEQSELSVRTEQRTLLSTRLTRGQLFEESPKVKEALAIWQEVRRESEKIVSEYREELRLAVEEAKAAKHSETNQESDSEDDQEDGGSSKVGDVRRKLRSALEVLHRAVFFCANGYHQIKSNKDMTVEDSEEFKALEKLETQAYEDAKVIRREMLHEALRKATSMKRQISQSAARQSFAEMPELPQVECNGIEGRAILDGLDDLYVFLNEQANQIDDWREHVIQLLLKALVDEDDEAEITGEEYDDSTKLQEEIIVYVQVLRALVHDRQDVLSGQKNNLVEHERKGAILLAKEGEGPYPEKVLELFDVREALNKTNPAALPAHRSLRAVLTELRTLSGKLRNEATGGNRRAAVELEMITAHFKQTTSILSEQNKVALALEQEVERFADAMNARVEFYRQFQAISDMVAKFEGPKDDAAMAKLEKQEADSRQKLEKAESKHRYLLHLKDSDSASEESRLCVICQSSFSVGVLTVCGHQFCKECIQLWFRAHHNCPVCKRKLQHSNLHDITLKPQELKVHSDNQREAAAAGDETRTPTKSKRSTIYAEFNPQQLAEIKNIELDGPSFTTKVDTLVRHLLWLREADPGAKSIVFSQYQEFMEVLRLAFRRHRIGFTSFNTPDGITRFKEDAGVEVFLLHARAHSSGLNLVNASNVFLCEPLLNTALELQAIARVDRIGQQHETTVWLYIVDGTVEESIYNLSVQRRMEHMGRTAKGKSKESTPELMDASLEAANSLELQQASLSKLMGKGPSAGETVATGDLWQCLFGHLEKGGTMGQDQAAQEEHLRNNAAVRSFLAAEAAETRTKA